VAGLEGGQEGFAADRLQHWWHAPDPYDNGTIVGGRRYGDRELKGVHGVV